MNLTPLPFLLLRTPVSSFAAPDSQSRQDGILEEGVYLASRELWAEQQRLTATGKRDPKLTLALERYRIRSRSRCTPFGTFAGCTLLPTGAQETAVELAAPESHRRHVRLDNSCIWEIALALQAWPGVAAQLSYRPNNTIYQVGPELRYVEHVPEKGMRKHRIAAVKGGGATAVVLDAAAQGGSIAGLAAVLVREAYGTDDEAKAFVCDLIAAQLLQSDLEPAVTGADPFQSLAQKSAGLNGIGPVQEVLQALAALLAVPAPGLTTFRDIDSQLTCLCAVFAEAGITLSLPAHTLHTDLFLETNSAAFDHRLASAITSQVAELDALARPFSNPALDNFRKRFVARYDTAEVPLALVMDMEAGIGYGTAGDIRGTDDALLDGLPAAASTAYPSNDALTALTLRKYIRWLQDGTAGIDLQPEDLRSLKDGKSDCRYPASMYLLGSLYGKGGQPTADAFQFHLAACSGPSAASLAARFSPGDNGLANLLREVLLREEAAEPDAVFAEVAHLPQTRTANILRRPLLRRYEIAWAGISGADAARTITIDDLLVSVHDGKILLRSKRLNRRVIPRLSSAHNFGRLGLPVYRFLCDLQFDGYARPACWYWGALTGERHLPRVSYKDILLCKATWNFSEQDFTALPEEEEGQAAWFRAFREQMKLPATVALCDGDNTLVLDTETTTGRTLLLHYLRRFKRIKLEEVLQTPENAFVRDAAGNPFHNEIILPLRNEVHAPLKTKFPESATKLRRRFHPGSEWLYFKVYCGQKAAERFLVDTLLPFVGKYNTALFNRFFFIRYRDEFPHLRIRFQCADRESVGHLQKEFLSVLEPCLEEGTIHSISMDTYDREIERYGEDRMLATEALFHADSHSVLQLLRLLDESEESGRYRILLALRGIDGLLGDFGLLLPQKQQLLEKCAGAFARERGATPALQKHLNDKYRQYQKDIFLHMDATKDAALGLTEAAAILSERSAAAWFFVPEIINAINTDGSNKLQNYLSSLLHMFMNRMFPARQRSYELVLYHFLHKYYSSRVAIDATKHTSKTAVLS